MTPERRHAASFLLAALAVLGLVLTHGQRQTAARDYAQTAGYNRAITSFLFDHRDQLLDQRVAVLGVSGLSPFSLTNGRYLTRLLGAPSSWHVYVPRDDPFYPLGTYDRGTITVRPESFACELGTSSPYVVFDDEGRGRIARDCEAALQAAHPPPDVEDWVPKRVTPEQAAAGFDMAVTGRHLGGAIALRVDGRALTTVHGRRGQLMTASIPPQPSPGTAISVTLEHRDRPALQMTIEVGAGQAKTPGGAGGSGTAAPRRNARP